MWNIVTNGHAREVMYGYELPEEWRAGIDVDGETQYVRYRESTYIVSDFSADWGITRGTGLPSDFYGWDGYLADSMSTCVLIRYADAECESVIMARAWHCDCTEEFGPCAYHSEELAQRVGSSNRSADELSAVFLSDAADILTANGSAFPADWEDVRALVDDEASWSGSWLRDDATVPNASEGYSASDAVREASDAAESALADIGVHVSWDDGFRIYRLTGGPLQS